MTRIAIVSEKGGVGKTTIALNLALALAERGRRILLADLDPQGGIGLALNSEDAALPGLSDYLMNDVSWEDALLKTTHPNLLFLPRGRLDPIDTPEYEVGLHSAGVLQRALDEMEATTEHTLLDCPSGLGLITRACLNAVDFALIPFQAEPMSIRSIHRTLRVIEQAQTQNAKLELLGILPTMVENTRKAAHAVMMELWSGFEGVLDTAIPRSEVFSEASLRGVPIAFLAGSPSPEERRFQVLASEIDALIEAHDSRREENATLPERSLL